MKLKLKLSFNIIKSKAGYIHIPLLYLGFGNNGFLLRIPLIDILFTWR